MNLPLTDRNVPLPLGMEQDDLSISGTVPETVEVDAVPEDGMSEYDDLDLTDEDRDFLFGEPEEEQVDLNDLDHDANLAIYMDEKDLRTLSSELLQAVDDDLESRKDWMETITEGRRLMGLEYEHRSVPFEHASGVFHPLLAESVVQFQANAYKELLPPEGPVRTHIIGEKTPEKQRRASRIKAHMNFMITDVIEEFDPDTDQMLYHLPLTASCFKKTYFDPELGRPTSLYVPAEDMIVPYAATSLRTTPRLAHRVRMTNLSVERQQMSGIFRDVELQPPSMVERDDLQESKDEDAGHSPSMTPVVRTLYEIHSHLNLPGAEISPDGEEDSALPVPYVILIDIESQEILSIQRNWEEGDSSFRRNEFFTHYKFMPGDGFYGYGLLHLIGGLTEGATSLLRQLIDSGTLANLQGGFKARGIKVRDNDLPIQPGEFRDVDVPGGNIKDAILPLPYKEPSATLVSLLGALEASGQRFTNLIQDDIQNVNQEAPVGTTVALLERGLKVMSAIHKRLHYAQKRELRLLARVIAQHPGEGYPYDVAGEDRAIKAEDFSADIDILPVSDPNIFSMAQRVARAQSQLQLAQAAPEIHNLREAYYRMYEALEVEDIDEILPPPEEPEPMDPALEAGLLIHAQVPQAFPDQDHEAHIAAHLTLHEMWIIGSTPPAQGALAVHILQHVSFMARKIVDQEVQQITQMNGQEPGMPGQGPGMPGQGPGMFDDPQIEARVAQVTAQLMQELAPSISPPPPDDPLVSIRRRELDVEEQRVAAQMDTEQQRQLMDMLRLAQKDNIERERIRLGETTSQSRTDVNRERIQVQQQNSQDRLRLEQQRLEQQRVLEQQRLLQQRQLEQARLAIQRITAMRRVAR